MLVGFSAGATNALVTIKHLVKDVDQHGRQTGTSTLPISWEKVVTRLCLIPVAIGCSSTCLTQYVLEKYA